MLRTTVKILEDGEYYVEVYALPDVWAAGSSEEAALAEHRSIDVLLD